MIEAGVIVLALVVGFALGMGYMAVFGRVFDRGGDPETIAADDTGFLRGAP